MRIHHLVLLLLPLCALPLNAQPSSDDLYFPPEISVGVSQDFAVEMRLTHQAYREEVLRRLKFGDHLKGSVRYITYTEPILPVIYFDPASYVIPERYRQLRGPGERDEYRDDESVAEQRWVSRYYGKYCDLLNVVGYRMRYNSHLRIELEGTWSTEPGENEGIARERAIVVAEYLERIWDIEPERIRIREARCRVDSSDHVMRQEEGRSVRIIPDDRRLLSPLTYQIAGHHSGAFSMKVNVLPQIPVDDVRSARLRFIVNDEIVSEVRLPPAEIFDEQSITWYVGWRLPRSLTSSVTALHVQVLVEGENGRVRASEARAIPIRWKEDRRGLQRMSRSALQYEYLVMPFEGGDTAMSDDDDKERRLVEWLHAIAPELEALRDSIEWIEVIGFGDISEVEGIDPVGLATAMAIHRNRSQVIDLFFDGSDDLPNIYSTDVPMTEDGSLDYGAAEDRVYRERYGEGRNGVMIENKELTHQIAELVGFPERNSRLINRLASLTLARARSVSEYLCIALDTTDIPVRCMEQVTPRRYISNRNSLLWDPAVRVYRRSVHIRFILTQNVAPEARRER